MPQASLDRQSLLPGGSTDGIIAILRANPLPASGRDPISKPLRTQPGRQEYRFPFQRCCRDATEPKRERHHYLPVSVRGIAVSKLWTDQDAYLYEQPNMRENNARRKSRVFHLRSYRKRRQPLHIFSR